MVRGVAVCLLLLFAVPQLGPLRVTRHVAVGVSHTAVVTPDGSVWVWGDNSEGQLGDGTRQAARTPVRLAALHDATAVAASGRHTLVLGANGDVWGWGALRSDEPAQLLPTLVAGLPRVIAVAAGDHHAVALGDDGALYAWGDNDAGQLADETTVAARVPVRVPLPGAVMSLSAGPASTTVTLRDGRTLRWGSPDPPVPAALRRYAAVPWAELSIGRAHAVAITADGRVFTWGSNREGALGDGTDESQLEPVEISGPGFAWKVATPAITGASESGDTSGIRVASATPGATIHYTLDGSAPGVTTPTVSPGEVLPVAAPAVFQARAFHPSMPASNLARRTFTASPQGPAVTPGSPARVAETPASRADVGDPRPPAVRRDSGGMVQLSATIAPVLEAGAAHSLLLTDTQVAWGWGVNGSGQVGDGTTTGPRVRPTAIASVTTATSISGGGGHSAAVNADQSVALWGGNGSGQIGNGTQTVQPPPLTLTTPTGVLAVSTGDAHTLALKSDATVAAWGANSNRQLGDGTTTMRTSPVSVSGLSGATAVAAGGTHSLALKSDGTVMAWGNNASGQLGDGTNTPRATPVTVSGITGVVAIAAGQYHSLALKTDGTVAAWGANGFGQLGDTSTQPRTTPVAVTGLANVTAVAAGANFSLALKADGSVVAWGLNSNGELGDGSAASWRSTAAAVSTLSGIVAIAAGDYHGLALSSDGVAWAWGRNTDAQLGDGTAKRRSTPVPLSDPAFTWKVATPTIGLTTGTYQATQNVVVACATAGATIHYTTNGVDPTEADSVVVSGGTVSVTESLTLKVKAWKSGTPSSNIDGETYTLRVPTPTLTPGTGTYAVAQSVVVSVAVSGVTLHYTTTGVDPTPSDPVVASGGAVVVDQPVILKVKGWRTNWTASTVGSATYTMKVGTPALTPGGGSYASVPSVTITTITPAATIHYTTNGVEPTTSDPTVVSGGTVLISASGTLRAVAVRTGWTASDTAQATYVLSLGTVATPTFSPSPGTFAAPQTVTIASTTSGATIRYTIDGTEPTLQSPLYGAPVVIGADATLKARAFKVDWGQSAIGTATYLVDSGAVATPTISPGSGPLPSARPATVTVSTPGATIHYTLNGLDPTESDPVVASGGTVIVDKALRLKVKAWKTGRSPSGVRTGDYWLTGAVAAGRAHSLALTASGQVFAWGLNGNGQLGDNSTTDRWSPTLVSGLTDVVAIAAGAWHSVAVKRDGTVWAWGLNAQGQLGNGTTNPALTPVQVTGLTDVTGLAAGDAHTLAVTRAGTVYAWGVRGFGQLGDGLVNGMRTTPYAIPTLSGVVAVAAGSYHSLAIRTDGTASGVLWGWGRNDAYQLGDRTTTNRLTPIAGLTNVTAVDGGATHTIAVRSDGTLWGWGMNGTGLLGDGTTSPRSTPTVSPSDAQMARVALGTTLSLGLASDATAWVWGENFYGQSGDGLGGPANRLTPIRIAGGGTAVVDVAAGERHGLALRRDGTVVGWGYNLNGQVGDGTNTQRDSAVLVPNFSVFDNSWLTGDQDGDGLSTLRELEVGSDPRQADTNGDGVLDGAAVNSGLSATSLDMDGDGVLNTIEVARRTDPLHVDTDRDGVQDGVDFFPLDPTRSQGPQPVPGDTTPPVITLIYPEGAVLLPPP